ncbi:MAG: carbohydrate ABC transporter substrate-binding protein [Clostridiaceae bacterium]|nr:carbohydrate ABC transporter substrate-binding protein [Clostridiaceae bacterium]
MKKRLLTILLTTSFVASALAGCSSSSTSTSTGGTGGKKVTITLMQNKVEIQDQLEAAATAFNKSQNGVEVKILGVSGTDYIGNLQAQFASTPEKAATIFTAQGGAEGERFLKFMAPIEGSKATEKIAEGLKAGAVADGKLYGLPTTVEGFGLIYNKTMFKAAGIDAAAIKNVDDLIAACKKLQTVKGVVNPIGFAKESYFQFMHPFNVAFATDKDYMTQVNKLNKKETTFKDIPSVKKFAEDFDKLKGYTNKAMDKYDDQVAGFASGKYAMIHQGNWAAGMIADDKATFEYGMMPFPMAGNDSLSVGVASYFRINKAASVDQQKASIKFLDWLITDPSGQDFYVNKLKFIPPYTGLNTDSLDPLAKDVSAFTTKAKTLPWALVAFPSGTDQPFADQVQKYYANKLDINQLLDELTKVWASAIK